MYDYHVHSNYSDGEALWSMVAAADAAGLDGVGIADHCIVVPAAWAARARRHMAFNLDATYERRRAAIEEVREAFDLRVFDAAELDYHPDAEADIRAFLDDAGFDYAVGSVHRVAGANVHDEDHFAALPESDRRAAVDAYFDRLVALVDSELFEIAAHVDLVERNPALRGLATAEQYDRVADAFADSRTVPEVNAGRVRRDYGRFHPTTDLFETLRSRGISFTLGSDAHDPADVGPLADELRAFAADNDLDPVGVDAGTDG